MPLVEYRCADCGRVSEVLRRPGADEAPACEECGGEDLERLFSSFSARAAAPAPASRCDTCPDGSCPFR
jgi:putative FmdB family regulatory protein